MSIKELKMSIAEIIDQVNDDTVLEAYYEILKKLLTVHNAQIVGYDTDGEPISKEVLEKKVLSARKKMESGNSTNNKDLKSDFKNW